MRLLLFGALTFCFALTALADEPGFIPLFDGKSLAGWQGRREVFRVEKGAIVAGTLDDRIAHNEFLSTGREFGDFELRLDAKLIGQGRNAGVQFRSKRIPDHHEMIGYQCDMGAMRDDLIWGALYDESRRRKFLSQPPQAALQEAFKRDDWNALVIRCQGPKVEIWVNGVKTADYTEPDDSIDRRGLVALQIHGGPPAEAWYRNIRIKELSQN